MYENDDAVNVAMRIDSNRHVLFLLIETYRRR